MCCLHSYKLLITQYHNFLRTGCNGVQKLKSLSVRFFWYCQLRWFSSCISPISDLLPARLYFFIVFLAVYKLYFHLFPSCISINIQVVFLSMTKLCFHLNPSCISPISSLSVSALIDIPIPAVNGTPKGGPSPSSQTNIPPQKFLDVRHLWIVSESYSYFEKCQNCK